MGLAKPDRQMNDDQEVPIRDAATTILVRNADTAPAVLMGQRGRNAVFMPDKFVFPGGAVDKTDADINLNGSLNSTCANRLRKDSSGVGPGAIAAASIRELWEETGQCLARSGDWPDPPEDWTGFAAHGLLPDASALHFFFRALTPPGRPRRFDARFFLANADALASDPDDFSEATEELSHLHWVRLDEVRKLNLPFITRVVLGELTAHLPRTDAPDRVPFVKNDQIDSKVVWL